MTRSDVQSQIIDAARKRKLWNRGAMLPPSCLGASNLPVAGPWDGIYSQMMIQLIREHRPCLRSSRVPAAPAYAGPSSPRSFHSLNSLPLRDPPLTFPLPPPRKRHEPLFLHSWNRCPPTPESITARSAVGPGGTRRARR